MESNRSDSALSVHEGVTTIAFERLYMIICLANIGMETNDHCTFEQIKMLLIIEPSIAFLFYYQSYRWINNK